MKKLDYDYIASIVDYFNRNRSTVRETAKHFKIPKSTVYNYLTKIMPNAASSEILQKNKAERHIRGGESAKKKFLAMRSQL